MKDRDSVSNFFDTHFDTIRILARKFNSYDDTDAYTIRQWIHQFDEDDWPLAIKILNYIDFYKPGRIITECRNLYEQLESIPNYQINRTIFSVFGGPGHSNSIILPSFRRGSGLRHYRYDSRFEYYSTLYQREPDAWYVFIEDFVGSGDSIIRHWSNLSGFYPPSDDLFLLTIAIHDEALTRLNDELPFEVIQNRLIRDNEKYCSEENQHFSADEKERIHHYCEIAGENPMGWGDCQSNVIFHYRSPNNTISLLRSNNARWHGLFKRYI